MAVIYVNKICNLIKRFSQHGRVWTTTAFTQVVREHTRELNAKPFAKTVLRRFGVEELLDIPKKAKV